MIRMPNILSHDSAHDSKRVHAHTTFVNSARKGIALLMLASVVSTGALAASAAPAPKEKVASVVAVKEQKDPLAGDTWHAITAGLNSSWPGTLVFDGAKKKVTLAPVGVAPMEATYTYTVKPSSSDKVVEGTLRMTNTAKQVSDSTFRIEGKTLTLMFGNGQRPEQYVRMTPKEEAAEKAKLEKLISEGRIRPLK